MPTPSGAAFRIEDAYGNLVTTGAGATASVDLALSGGTAGALLGGTKPKAAAGGLVSFGDLTVRKVGTAYKLTATSGSLTTADTTTFNITLGALQLTFSAEPIDSEVASSIRSSISGDPVKVRAGDQWGNAGASTSVAMTAATYPGDASATLGGTISASTGADGVATFANLTLAQLGTYSLKANATGLSEVASLPFEIVADWAACDGGSCSNSATTGGSEKQVSFSTIDTNGDFDNEVVLTTQFLSTITGQCEGDVGSFGQTTEVRVQGAGVSETSPDFKVVLMFPKTTLQALGLSSRNADSFNVCLGATRLVAGDPYQAKTSVTNSALTPATLSGGA